MMRNAAHAILRLTCLGGAVWVAMAPLAAAPVTAATFTVVNNNDSGAGSLRDAVAQANLAPPPNTVNFDKGITNANLTKALPAP
jgi:hypothetical protein